MTKSASSDEGGRPAMSRADLREQLPTHPTRRAMVQARRATWEPNARDLEIARLRDDEGLTIRAIATRMGLSRSRVHALYRRYDSRMTQRAQEAHDTGDADALAHDEPVVTRRGVDQR